MSFTAAALYRSAIASQILPCDVAETKQAMDIRGYTFNNLKAISRNGIEIYKDTLQLYIGYFEKVRLFLYIQGRNRRVFLDVVLDEPFTNKDNKKLNAYYARKREGLSDVETREINAVRSNKRGKYTWLADVHSEAKK